MFKFTADTSEKGVRLDVAVAAHVSVLSRASVQKLSDQEKITVNGKAAKISYRLRPSDTVVIDYDALELKQIPDVDIPVLYEDDDCIVIDKPIGLLTHSKGAFNPEATVATWLERRMADKPIVSNTRYGIVHRLDRATSGVMIVAKTPEALLWLQKQFSSRLAKKTYVALIEGRMEPRTAIIDMPIERNPKKPQTFRVGPNGKPAITAYETTASNDKFSQLKLSPRTGRTHQLRVHLNNQNHPIIGDQMYDGQPAERLYLHAFSLEITLPNHQRKTFTAPLPPEFAKPMK